MCGRFTLHLGKSALSRALAEAFPDSSDPALPEPCEPDYNIGPGREILVVAVAEEPGAGPPAPGLMHWGLRTPQNFHVNARIETADTSPRFRDGWEARRCLVPANGFYEWYEDGISKRPHYFYPAGGGLLFLAGLWFPSQVEEHPASCVLLTSEANPSVKPVHHRMPVILPPASFGDWLGHRMPKAAAVALASSAGLDSHPVSQRVNSVRNNDSRLIEAASPLNEDQLSLF